MEVKLEDLVLAYRKAKVDMYYSGLPCKAKLLEFEEEFEYRIRRLWKLLRDKNLDEIYNYCHGWLLIPKKIKFKKKSGNKGDSLDASVVFSDPFKEYAENRVDECELRLMADVPVEFHVITTWWVLTIGEKLERCLSQNSYGNRIRRTKDQSVGWYSLGTFVRYLGQYHAWRDNGLKVIRDSVSNHKDIVAVTADFTAFYHSIKPDFLTDRAFYSRLDPKLELSQDEFEYTELIVEMLREWAKDSALKRGLPVGCSVSAVIANLALAELDKQIEKEVVPLYYGRYVDDVIIVLENTNGFSKAQEVWKWLEKRVNGLFVGAADTIDYVDKMISPSSGVKLSFEKEKTKVFMIDAESGDLLIDTLDRQIRSRSSEWRALPDFPEDANVMTAKILSACNEAGEEVDNLRKVDALSLKRAVFAMTVRDFESYGRSISPKGWSSVRVAFLKLIEKHFTDVKSFFDLHAYLPRILATACNSLTANDEDARTLIKSIVVKLFDVIERLSRIDIKPKIAGGDAAIKAVVLYDKLRDYLARQLSESVSSAVSDLPIASFDIKRFLGDRIKAYDKVAGMMDWYGFYEHDLAYQPARTYFTGEAIGNFNVQPSTAISWLKDNDGLFEPGFWQAMVDFVEKMPSYKPHPQGCALPLLFPTRPLNTYELTEMWSNPYDDDKKDKRLLCSFLQYERGYAAGDGVFPTLKKEALSKDIQLRVQPVADVGWSRLHWPVNVALANWMTNTESFISAICQTDDPDEVARYNRLMRLVNAILAAKIKVDYVVFPELSIPLKWFAQIALKLRVSGISLIAGVEYIHEQSLVRNQVWCSLVYDSCGFPNVAIYKMEKVRPALHEAEELRSRAGLAMTSEAMSGRRPDVRDVVFHGDLAGKNFSFSSVVCSDLTNVDYRSQLRGKIDALFVPSWNMDKEVFSSLVESAAYDVHAYVVQCNDRAYGDTRIRAPTKERYDRDIVKIKGGELDYFVVGKIDVEKLRRFQSFSISPTSSSKATYKPVPAGFEIAGRRRIAP